MSKTHARADGQGRVGVGFVLTGGEVSDYKAVDELFALPVKTPKMMLADKGYDGDEVRTTLLMIGVLPVIPPKSNRKQQIACDFAAYKDRNCIERMFNRLKQARRIATRYDKTAISFLRARLRRGFPGRLGCDSRVVGLTTMTKTDAQTQVAEAAALRH